MWRMPALLRRHNNTNTSVAATPNAVGLSPPRGHHGVKSNFSSPHKSGGWDLSGGMQQVAASSGSMLQSAWDAPKFQEISGNINFIDYPHMRRASVALQRRCASVAFVFCTLPLNRYCFPHQRRTLLAAKAFALCEIPTTCCMLPAGWLFVVAPSLSAV